MPQFLDQQKVYRDCLREVHGDSPNLESTKSKLKEIFLKNVGRNEENKVSTTDKKFKFQIEDKRSLELAFRSSLEELVKKIRIEGLQDNSLPESLKVLLDLSFLLAKQGFIESTTPFSLVEATLDYHTVDGCCKIFEFLESRIITLRDPKLWSKMAQLAFLRICNGLLRRISKANNTIFSGKILILMAYVFPLDDPSGQNKNSKFNLDNVTPIYKAKKANRGSRYKRKRRKRRKRKIK